MSKEQQPLYDLINNVAGRRMIGFGPGFDLQAARKLALKAVLGRSSFTLAEQHHINSGRQELTDNPEKVQLQVELEDGNYTLTPSKDSMEEVISSPPKKATISYASNNAGYCRIDILDPDLVGLK